MKTLKYGYVPRKYQLSWDSEKKGIRIHVHNDCIRQSRIVADPHPIVTLQKERLGFGMFDSFCGDLRLGSFGFNKIISKTIETGDYTEFFVSIPQIKRQLNIVCKECGGSGSNPDRTNDDCLYCRASGKSHTSDWRVANLTTASLGLFFETVQDTEPGTSASEVQHTNIVLLSQSGQNGSSIGGCFGVDFSDYLLKYDWDTKPVIQKAIKAMREAHDQMLAMRSNDLLTIKADVSDGGYLTLECWGNACAVHSCGHYNGAGHGREFSSHNVDSPAQALTFLAAIASMTYDIDLLLPNTRRGEMRVA
jgi:hypothetical protein